MCCIRYDVDLYGVTLRRLRNVLPGRITRATDDALEIWMGRMGMEMIHCLSNLRAFVDIGPAMEGKPKIPSAMEIGSVVSEIGYWGGVISECGTYAGVMQRWGEDNAVRYDVWPPDPKRIAAMWGEIG